MKHWIDRIHVILVLSRSMDTVINLQVLCVVLFGHLDGSRDFIPFLSVFLLLFPSNPPQSHHSLLGGNVKRLPFNDHLIGTKEITKQHAKNVHFGFSISFSKWFLSFSSVSAQLVWYPWPIPIRSGCVSSPEFPFRDPPAPSPATVSSGTDKWWRYNGTSREHNTNIHRTDNTRIKYDLYAIMGTWVQIRGHAQKGKQLDNFYFFLYSSN